MRPNQAPNLLNKITSKELLEFHLPVFLFDEESADKIRQEVVHLLSRNRKQVFMPLTVQSDVLCIKWGIYNVSKDDNIE